MITLRNKADAITHTIAEHISLYCTARRPSSEKNHHDTVIARAPPPLPSAELGKQTLFITNNSAMHSDDYKDRFQRCVSLI
jgi:hypothetical protein